jgi:gas vesicle protein
MFFKKKKDDLDIKKKAGQLDKIITGVIIGGAIGSVLGVTLSDKEKREAIKEKSKEFIETQKDHIKERIESSKKSDKGVIGKIIKFFGK